MGNVDRWGNNEGQGLPTNEDSTQDRPEPILDPEVIELTPDRTAATITRKLVYSINGDMKDVYDASGDGTKTRGLLCRSVALLTRERVIMGRRSSTRAI